MLPLMPQKATGAEEEEVEAEDREKKTEKKRGLWAEGGGGGSYVIKGFYLVAVSPFVRFLLLSISGGGRP